MNINLFLLNHDNFTKINNIYKKLEEKISEQQRFHLKKINNNFYLINKDETIHHLISYDNKVYQVTKFIELIEEINLIKECESNELKWLDNLYLNQYPKIENELKYFTLSAINKLLKENKELKERIEYLESKLL